MSGNNSIDIYNLMKLKQALLLANQLIQEMSTPRTKKTLVGLKHWNSIHHEMLDITEGLITIFLKKAS